MTPTSEGAPAPGRRPRTRLLRWLLERPIRAALLCAALGVLVHANTLRNGFAYDDVHILVENEAIHDVRNLPGLLIEPYWPGEFGDALGLWRPATTLTLGVQWALWGGRPAPFHLVNALAHGVATALVVVLIGALATPAVALLAGLVFAVHPVHTEAVANVVGLAEIQAAIFFLTACILHVRAGPPLERGSYGLRRGALVAVLYLGAFLTKESAVTLPGALFLIDAARRRIGLAELRPYARARGAVYGVLAGVAAAVLAGRVWVLGSVASPLGPLGADLLEQGVPRIWTVAGIWPHYLRLMVLPLDLASDYSPSVLPIALGWGPLNVLGVVLALATLAIAWRSWREPELASGSATPRLIGFGVLWFVIVISPISNVFFLAGVLLAERTLYLPSVGAVAVAGWLLAYLWERRRRAALVTTVCVVGWMAAWSWRRNPTWHDMGTVFGTLIRDYPQSGRSQWILGDAFFDRGERRQALRSYSLAINILGGHPQLLTQIAQKLMQAGEHRAARGLLEYAWRYEPEWDVPPGYLAVSYFQTGEWPEAERYARASLDRKPDQRVVPHVLSIALAAQGRFRDAIPWREYTIAHGEGERWEQWMLLARLRLTVGDAAGAQMARDSALARAPGPAEIRQIGSTFLPYDPPAAPL